MTGIACEKSTISDAYDAIVIGSGMGGLTAAALLAQHAGSRVLVLERQDTAGGFTHGFERQGYEWDVGVHYVGRVSSPRSEERAAFDRVTEGRLRWNALPEVYDRVRIGGLAFDFAGGMERLRDDLHRRFPSERRAIDRYLALLVAIDRASRTYWQEKAIPRPLSRLVGPLLRGPFLRYTRRTTAEVLGELTHDRELIALLASQWLNYGLPPARSSFAIHGIVAYHYLEGAAYPVGGGGAIAAALTPAIERAGGAIVLSAEVERILVERGRAIGARIVGGREVRARTVISDAGIFNTFSRLLAPETAARFQLLDSLRELEPSMSHLCLYIGMDGPASGGDVVASNLWVHPSTDLDGNVERSNADPNAPFPVLFISFPSAKDPTFAARHPGCATAEIIIPAPFAWFERWSLRRSPDLGAEYDSFKHRLMERILGEFAVHAPEASRRVKHAELSTPLTTLHFASTPRGGIHGAAPTPARFRSPAVGPFTPIRNLYLTGADACLQGVTGTLYSGILAASASLGRNLLAELRRSAAKT